MFYYVYGKDGALLGTVNAPTSEEAACRFSVFNEVEKADLVVRTDVERQQYLADINRADADRKQAIHDEQMGITSKFK